MKIRTAASVFWTFLSAVLKATFKSSVVLVFLLMLAFTVASHTVSSLAMLTSSAISALTGLQTIHSLRDREIELERQSSRQTRAALDRQNGKIRSLELEAEDLRATNAALVDRNNQEVASRDRRISGLTVEADNLRSQNAALARRNAQQMVSFVTFFRSQLDQAKLIDLQASQHRAAMRNRVNRMQSRVAKTASVNASSVWAESIPVYGVGIVVAATTFELASACDTMHDLYELEIQLDPTAAIPETHDEMCGWKVPTQDEIWQAIKSSPRQVWSTAVEGINGVGDWASDLDTPNFSALWTRLVSRVGRD